MELTPVQIYEKALENYNEFIALNRGILDLMSSYSSSLSDAETRLKTFARDAKPEDLSSNIVSVSVYHPIKRWYDYETLMENASKKEKDLILNLCVSKKVDADSINSLVLSGEIKGATTANALVEEEQTPRVTIKIK